MREATGGSPALWLILGGFVVLVLAYRAVLIGCAAGRADRGRAGEADAPAVEEGPFSNAELERYARHITCPISAAPGSWR
jgi:hypothetical protein